MRHAYSPTSRELSAFIEVEFTSEVVFLYALRSVGERVLFDAPLAIQALKTGGARLTNPADDDRLRAFERKHAS
jgi:hypothetical protein